MQHTSGPTVCGTNTCIELRFSFFLYLVCRTKNNQNNNNKFSERKTKKKPNKQTKRVHAAWNEFRSHAGPLRLVGGACRPNRGWSTGGRRPGWLRFTFTETHEEICPFGFSLETIGRLESSWVVVGFFCFFLNNDTIFQKVKLFVCKK